MMKTRQMMTTAAIMFLAAGIFLQPGSAAAKTILTGTLPIFSAANGWTMIAQEDGHDSKTGYVGPGWGGQDFDAEFLFYQMHGSILTIGLQTGFDVVSGYVWADAAPKHYYAGDLALSFDGNIATGLKYEYAVDFGLLTKDYQKEPVGGGTGQHAAGLYAVTQWNNDVYGNDTDGATPTGTGGFTKSNPFAMHSGTMQTDALIGNAADYNTTLDTYYRIVSFDLSKVTSLAGYLKTGFSLDAHWTMSCGNDVLNGKTDVAPVPEPATLFLFGTGVTGLVAARRKKMA